MPRNGNNPDRELTLPEIVAHRGASADSPENTQSAFDLAVSAGAGGIELDLQLSKEGVPVVYHDATLKKAGLLGKCISGLTLSELRRLDVGSWFSAAFAGEKMPTLDRVLKRYGRKLNLLLEIKADDKMPDRDLELASLIARESRGLIDSVYILSFSLTVLQFVNEIDPRLRCVLNIQKRPRLTRATLERYEFLHALSISVRELTVGFVNSAHEHGFSTMTYTPNRRKEVDLALACGVDVLMTDRPGWVLEYLGRA